MESSVARTRSARVVPRVRPKIAPRAPLSQYGAPRPTKAGHDIGLRAITASARQRLRLGGQSRSAELIAQPLHRRSGDKDRAFQRIGGLARPASSAEVRHQPIVRRDRALAGMRQQERAGAVGDLGVRRRSTRR